MATIVKTPSGTWKAVIRKTGWPTSSKTFRTKRDAEDWARRTEDEMVRGVYIQRTLSERMTVEAALKRYLQEVTPTKRESTRISEYKKARPLPASWQIFIGRPQRRCRRTIPRHALGGRP